MRKKANRAYKDSMFRMLFNNEDKLRELYNAIKGTNYGEETEISIRTLKKAIYLDLKNDVAFSIGNEFIILVEHQSTLCPNMPIRMAEYIGRVLEELLGKQVYQETALKIPVPEFYVLYNGTKDCRDINEYRLSDNFIEKPSENSMELVVKMIDISYNKHAEILQKSNTMREYSLFVSWVNQYRKTEENLEKAVEKAIRKSREENILTEFLRANGTEVLSMLFTEVTREEYGDIREQEGLERGREETKKVFMLQAQGKSISEIARACSLPEKTVAEILK